MLFHWYIFLMFATIIIFQTRVFMHFLCNYTFDALVREISGRGEPLYIVNQILNWIYDKNITSWDEMSNISVERRKQLSSELLFPCLKLIRVLDLGSNLFKFHWELDKKSIIESVLIGSTIYISTHVGYAPRHTFCVPEKRGFKRNLKVAEIVEQVILSSHWLKEKGKKISHVVFMGMGDPLKNYDAVISAVNILSDPRMFNLSERKISISTVGDVEGINRLSHEGVKLNLILSLHAPEERLRKKVVPYALKDPIEKVLSAMDEYYASTHGAIQYDYTLLEGINDHPDQAFQLANLLGRHKGMVNLTPFHTGPGGKLSPSPKKNIKAFRSVLYGSGIKNSIGE